ncbi:MAG: hypothetical protein QNJ45_17315 [Ardenticatenaceae bacterium]|nr:hypothetical protein [Ardenticatenaceae bacterium]
MIFKQPFLKICPFILIALLTGFSLSFLSPSQKNKLITAHFPSHLPETLFGDNALSIQIRSTGEAAVGGGIGFFSAVQPALWEPRSENGLLFVILFGWLATPWCLALATRRLWRHQKA